MNNYINLNRIEFVVTLECSGRCKHCSVGDKLHTGVNKHIDTQKAVDAIIKLSKMFNIESVMTFGGESLLYHNTTVQIHNTAKDCGINERQLITNGNFSKDKTVINDVAKKLYDAGVNSLLVSVDCFHQETIPIDVVACFVQAALRGGVLKISGCIRRG